MKRLIPFLCLLIAWSPAALAQAVSFGTAHAQEVLPAPSILRNSITTLHAEGDTLWTNPFLSLTYDGDGFAAGERWFVADTEELRAERDLVFSLDIQGPVVWAGLGFTSDEGQPSAAGFLVSHDGGATFAYRTPQIDASNRPEQLDTLRYGAASIAALPVVVPQQSPPYDIAYDPGLDQVWVAGWASGIRLSSDGGRTWHRVVLPPDRLSDIYPDSTYDFVLAPKLSPRDTVGSYNHQGFSVLVDETGTVWAGTPAGINRSGPDDRYTVGDSTYRAWHRTAYDGTPRGLTGSWVTAIEEQPLPGRNAIWLASWNAGEAGELGQDGITVTRDGGETFEQVLLGERIYDFAFRDETIYAAGRRSGLFISEDGGQTWRTVRRFAIDRSQPGQADAVVPAAVEVFAVATTPDALWVGTSEGLFKSTDGAATWTLYRTEVPLKPDPEGRFADQPEVEAFAYPNPFSPAVDQLVRIRYETSGEAATRVRIFDFGMNLVRSFQDACTGSGTRTCEAEWNGTDDDGLRVANGPYFYALEAGDDTMWGKILVLE